jgi:hypothetical protein
MQTQAYLRMRSGHCGKRFRFPLHEFAFHWSGPISEPLLGVDPQLITNISFQT